MNNKKKVLLTGFTGFLGPHLAQVLIREGFDLRLVFHRHTVTNRDRLKKAEVLWGSLDNPDVVKRAMNGIDVVVHSAWSPFSSSNKRSTNTAALELLLSESAAAGVEKFSFLSSVAVYGMRGKRGEDIKETNPYAEGKDLDFYYPSDKIAAERVLLGFDRKDMQLGIFRPGPIFDDKRGMSKKIIKFGPWRLGIGIGTGTNRMAYIHARDVAEAIMQWLNFGKDGTVFNVVPSRCFRAKDWMKVWGLKHDLDIKPVYVPGFFVRVAGFGVKILKKLMGRKGGSNVKYAVACAKRNLSYSNAALQEDLNWKDKATSEYTDFIGKKAKV